MTVSSIVVSANYYLLLLEIFQHFSFVLPNAEALSMTDHKRLHVRTTECAHDMLTVLADDAVRIRLVRDADLMIMHRHTVGAAYQYVLCIYILIFSAIQCCYFKLLCKNFSNPKLSYKT